MGRHNKAKKRGKKKRRLLQSLGNRGTQQKQRHAHVRFLQKTAELRFYLPVQIHHPRGLQRFHVLENGIIRGDREILEIMGIQPVSHRIPHKLRSNPRGSPTSNTSPRIYPASIPAVSR